MNWPGGSCFAPESLLDKAQRRVFWAWVVDQRESAGHHNLGVMTLPRVLTLDTTGQLVINPAVELESLRRNPRRQGAFPVAAEEELCFEDFVGDSAELILEAMIPEEGVFGIKVRMTADGAEQTVIIVDRSSNTISVDTNRSSLRSDIFQSFPVMDGNPSMDVRVQTAPLTLAADEPLRLRIFLDRSILEIFANGQCVTQRIYPTRADSLGLALFSRGGTVDVLAMDAWDMEATNAQVMESPDPLHK